MENCGKDKELRQKMENCGRDKELWEKPGKCETIENCWRDNESWKRKGNGRRDRIVGENGKLLSVTKSCM